MSKAGEVVRILVEEALSWDGKFVDFCWRESFPFSRYPRKTQRMRSAKWRRRRMKYPWGK